MQGKEYYSHRFVTHTFRIISCNNFRVCVSEKQMAWLHSAIDEFEACENTERMKELCRLIKILAGQVFIALNKTHSLQKIGDACNSSGPWIRAVILISRRAYRKAEIMQQISAFPWESD